MQTGVIYEAGCALGQRLARDVVEGFGDCGRLLEGQHLVAVAEAAADIILHGGVALREEGRSRAEIALYTGAAFETFTAGINSLVGSSADTRRRPRAGRRVPPREWQ